MKKILFLGTTYYDFKKPEKVEHLKAKFEGLREAGFKIFVLARGRAGKWPWQKKAWGADFWLYPSRFLFFLDSFWAGLWLCIFKKIDVVVAQDPLLSGFFGALLKILLRKKLIVECHGDWWSAPFLAKKRRLVFFQKKIADGLAKISLRKADKIRCVARYLIEEAKKTAPKKQYFIFPTFTDLSSFLAEKETKLGDYFLFVGGLQKVKGLDYLIEAMSLRPVLHWRTDLKNWRLVIVGDGPERKNLEARVKDYGLEGKIELKGCLPLAEVRDLMKNCYCLVLPSLSEGLPRVVLEAMALRKPVIASRVGGIPEIIQDNKTGFLVEPGKPQQLAEKIKALLENKALAEKMGRVGRETVKGKFSNQRYLEQYMAMLQS